MLPKPDKDTSLIDNWKPMNLLNTDYKIGAKVIAHRIRRVLPKIIISSDRALLKDEYYMKTSEFFLKYLKRFKESQKMQLNFL